jgi:hypothetical protein
MNNVAALQNLVKSGEDLLAGLGASITDDDVRRFIETAQNYVILFIKSHLLEDIKNDQIIDKANKNELEKMAEKRKEMEIELKSLQETRLNKGDNTENLAELIQQSKTLISAIQENMNNSSSENYDSLVEMCKEEFRKLEEMQKEYDWYNSAYKKLSDFTGLQVINEEEHSFKLLDKYELIINEDSVKLTGNNVYVDDLNPSTSSNGVCVAQVFERLYALEDMQKCAKSLGWYLVINKDAPICTLTPQSNFDLPPALVALVGSGSHPLIEWGDVDPEEFNSIEGSMEEKFRKYLPKK